MSHLEPGEINRNRPPRRRPVSCIGPVIAGTLIVGLGGYGKAATIVGLFFVLGVVAAPFLPETNGKPLPDIV